MAARLRLQVSSSVVFLCVFVLALLGVLLYIRRQRQRQRQRCGLYESFASPSPSLDAKNMAIDYYWIVSEKRKPKMLEQIHDRNISIPNSIRESDITFVRGIFDDNLENAFHPGITKEWLSFPVVRLLAAHMNALRLFQKGFQNNPDRNNHCMICMEDDVVLHTNFEKMAQTCANYLRTLNGPARISMGYVILPTQKEQVITLADGIVVSRVKGAAAANFGTQCYMLSYEYVDMALKAYERIYSDASIKPSMTHASDIFLFDFPEAHHFIIEPLACIEDFPTFGTTLNHDWNAGLYDIIVRKYGRSNYYLFRK